MKKLRASTLALGLSLVVSFLALAQAARRVAITDAAERVADECKRLATG